MARNSNYGRNEKKREPKAPALIAYHVADRGEEKSFWTRIGAAWDHEDGKGFTLNLDLVPVSAGRIVLRVPSDKRPITQTKGRAPRRPSYLSAAKSVREGAFPLGRAACPVRFTTWSGRTER